LATGPGARKASDYSKGDAINERRRTYLQLITDLLVKDLDFLRQSWDINKKDSYAKLFVMEKPQDNLGKILTSLATLSGFELASERIATALDSGDQEDEHSCFSDSTHQDLLANIQGIRRVYIGQVNNHQTGPSIHQLIAQKDPILADKIWQQIQESERLISQLPKPFDQAILSQPKGSTARIEAEKVVSSLQQQAELLTQAGKVLGTSVAILRD
jgi:putative iron-regulated protein